MFNKTKIITNFTGLVGYQQPANPKYQVVNSGNQTSSSGRYYTDNDYVKIEYLKDTQNYQYVNDTVFNTYLTNKHNSAVTNVLDRVFSDSDFIDRQMLFRFANNKQNTETLPTGFVGYKIEHDYTKNLAIEITRCILEFSGTGTLKLVLFNSNKLEHLFEQDVSITSTLQEVTLNWRLDNSDIVYQGDYYFGYFVSDAVGVTPFARDYNDADFQTSITHLFIERIQVPTASSPNLFDLEDEDGASECWGLNPDITVFEDYTDLATQNKFLFANAIQIQGQIDLMSSYIASLRSNINERFAKEMVNKITVEINGANFGDSVKKVGLKTELLGQIQKIRKEINKLRDGYFINERIAVSTRS